MRWRARPRAEFAFVDLRDGERWTLRPNEGPLPLWMFADTRRVPGTQRGGLSAYAPLLWARRKAAHRRGGRVTAAPLWGG